MLIVEFLRQRARSLPSFAVALGMALGANCVWATPTNKPADNPGPITDHFSLRASFFAPTVSTDARFDNNAGQQGTLLNAERDLGLKDRVNQGRIELIFRLRPRHRVRVDYFKLERDGDKTLTRTINFGNSTYNVNDRVRSTINWRVLGLTYAWSVVQTKKFELGIGVGLHIIQAQASGNVRALNLRDDGSAVGAIPAGALDGTWQFARRWSANVHAQRLRVTVSRVTGSYADYHLDAQYRWRPNTAFGIGWTWLKTDVHTTGTSLPGAFLFNTRGPEAFFRVSF